MRAGDRLADPPGRVGAELVAAAVLELVDRLHQADVAFLDQVEELQAAVGVFLGDRDDQAQVGLDHFLLGDARLALALLDHVHDPAELAQAHAGGCGDVGDLGADALDRVGLGRRRRRPTSCRAWRLGRASSRRARGPT